VAHHHPPTGPVPPAPHSASPRTCPVHASRGSPARGGCSPRRRPHLGRRPLALCHHARVAPPPDALPHPSLAPASRHQAHAQGVIDGVEVVGDSRLYYPPSPDAGLLDRFDGVVAPTLGSTPVGGGLAVGLADGLDDQLARRLPHPLPDWSKPAGALPTIGFGNALVAGDLARPAGRAECAPHTAPPRGAPPRRWARPRSQPRRRRRAPLAKPVTGDRAGRGGPTAQGTGSSGSSWPPRSGGAGVVVSCLGGWLARVGPAPSRTSSPDLAAVEALPSQRVVWSR
jgi:hypothetical protein